MNFSLLWRVATLLVSDVIGQAQAQTQSLVHHYLQARQAIAMA